MNTKLTLSLNKAIIEQAKAYAKEQNVSLSSIIENYLLKVVSSGKPSTKHKGSIVEALSGIIQLGTKQDEDNFKAYLEEKHS